MATIFCDDNKKYLSTALTKEEPVRPGYLSPKSNWLLLARSAEFASPASNREAVAGFSIFGFGHRDDEPAGKQILV